MTAKPDGWKLIHEERYLSSRIIPDGTMRDDFNLPRGYWEAKDTHDDLDTEIKKKIAAGLSASTNIIFEDTRHAVLYQNGQRASRIRPAQTDASWPTCSTTFFDLRRAAYRGLRAGGQRVQGAHPGAGEGPRSSCIAQEHDANNGISGRLRRVLCSSARRARPQHQQRGGG